MVGTPVDVQNSWFHFDRVFSRRRGPNSLFKRLLFDPLMPEPSSLPTTHSDYHIAREIDDMFRPFSNVWRSCRPRIEQRGQLTRLFMVVRAALRRAVGVPRTRTQMGSNYECLNNKFRPYPLQKFHSIACWAVSTPTGIHPGLT